MPQELPIMVAVDMSKSLETVEDIKLLKHIEVSSQALDSKLHVKSLNLCGVQRYQTEIQESKARSPTSAIQKVPEANPRITTRNCFGRRLHYPNRWQRLNHYLPIVKEWLRAQQLGLSPGKSSATLCTKEVKLLSITIDTGELFLMFTKSQKCITQNNHWM